MPFFFANTGGGAAFFCFAGIRAVIINIKTRAGHSMPVPTGFVVAVAVVHKLNRFFVALGLFCLLRQTILF